MTRGRTATSSASGETRPALAALHAEMEAVGPARVVEASQERAPCCSSSWPGRGRDGQQRSAVAGAGQLDPHPAATVGDVLQRSVGGQCAGGAARSSAARLVLWILPRSDRAPRGSRRRRDQRCRRRRDGDGSRFPRPRSVRADGSLVGEQDQRSGGEQDHGRADRERDPRLGARDWRLEERSELIAQHVSSPSLRSRRPAVGRSRRSGPAHQPRAHRRAGTVRCAGRRCRCCLRSS
jgi:hypothetical protein